MPALPNVSNVLRYEQKYTLSEDVDVLMRLYFAYTGTAPTNTGLNTMATACESAWNTNIRGLTDGDTQITAINIVDLSSASAGAGQWTGANTGNRTGAAMAAGTSALLNFAVARRYRGGKPRAYLRAGTVTDLNDAQKWTTAFTTALLSGWNAYITAIIAAAPSGTTITGQVNVSYYSGFTNFTGPTGRIRARSTVKSGAELPIVPDVITGTSVNAKVASQRRRNLQRK